MVRTRAALPRSNEARHGANKPPCVSEQRWTWTRRPSATQARRQQRGRARSPFDADGLSIASTPSPSPHPLCRRRAPLLLQLKLISEAAMHCRCCDDHLQQQQAARSGGTPRVLPTPHMPVHRRPLAAGCSPPLPLCGRELSISRPYTPSQRFHPSQPESICDDGCSAQPVATAAAPAGLVVGYDEWLAEAQATALLDERTALSNGSHRHPSSPSPTDTYQFTIPFHNPTPQQLAIPAGG